MHYTYKFFDEIDGFFILDSEFIAEQVFDEIIIEGKYSLALQYDFFNNYEKNVLPISGILPVENFLIRYKGKEVSVNFNSDFSEGVVSLSGAVWHKNFKALYEKASELKVLSTANAAFVGVFSKDGPVFNSNAVQVGGDISSYVLISNDVLYGKFTQLLSEDFSCLEFDVLEDYYCIFRFDKNQLKFLFTKPFLNYFSISCSGQSLSVNIVDSYPGIHKSSEDQRVGILTSGSKINWLKEIFMVSSSPVYSLSTAI
jgi:hypothetical protein